MTEQTPITKSKLAHTILYVLRHAQVVPGILALNKLVFLIDYEHYRKHVRTVTGARYVALQNGPVLDDYRDFVEAMRVAGLLEIQKVPIAGQPNAKEEARALALYDEELFAESELTEMNAVLRDHGAKTGRELVRLTHDIGPWRMVFRPENEGAVIPPALFRWIDNMPDDADRDRAASMMAGIDLQAELQTV